MLLGATGIGVAPAATAASLQEVTNFGENPGNLRMHVYVPDARPASPPVLVAMHGCGGSGPGFHSGSEFSRLADRYGYIVIYPTATKQTAMSNCFDVWSDAAKRRGGGSDPASIASMVNHALQQYGGDRNRVYVTGSSSGGMMTNTMLALYPDLFRAGAVFMGVPFTCFLNEADYAPGTSQCVNGRKDQTPQQWGDAVRAAYSYAGTRPRVQLWHGDQDSLIPFQLLNEEMEQWTNVFGLSQTPASSDQPRSGWHRARFADASGRVQVESIRVAGAGHVLPQSGQAQLAIEFFGLDQPGATPSATPTPTATPTTSPSPTPTATPTTGPSPTGSAGACSATIRVVNSWGSGYQADVDVTAGPRAISGWTLTWTLAGGQTIAQAWNASVTTSGSAVTATNVSWNGAIAAGATSRSAFGFVGSGTPSAPSVTCTAR
ncbi:hypothetical protein GCM10009751_09850 [Myceligenerans crystallogenes]|uniref:CBM2 domain-containing protein n=1 Tax=Myceligenerans crystallogenes TaxID=316335 RepID=A0ABN2N8X5_9MICO